MWVRGLKHVNSVNLPVASDVAPYVGAWIETIMGNAQSPARESHPMWVRGLKQQYPQVSLGNPKSHPMWVRGLKHVLIVMELLSLLSRTLCGCVD